MDDSKLLMFFNRVAESTEEVSSLRPPRLIHEDGIIRPYDRDEAEGYDLFEVCFDALFFEKKISAFAVLLC